MKIFEIRWRSGEKEWISAETNIHAIKQYCYITSFDVWDFEEADEIVELPKEEWSKYTVKNEDEEDILTFEEWMERNSSPDIIAGTMYDC